MKRDNSYTVSRVCMERWPRLLSPTMAAAYLHMSNVYELENAGLADLAFEFYGRMVIDREDLDSAVDAKKPARRTEAGK